MSMEPPFFEEAREVYFMIDSSREVEKQKDRWKSGIRTKVNSREECSSNKDLWPKCQEERSLKP